MILLALALLAADGRPEWWTAPALGLDAKGVTFTDGPQGTCLDAVSATRVAGMLERCRAYPALVDRQLGALFDLHLSSIKAADAQGKLELEKSAAALTAESDSRWPAWQVAILGVGLAAVGIIVGGLLVLGQQAIQP